ncbi:MAG: NUDIX domain-containing protein [Candidatus Sericytochromatia bacterium]
MSREPLPIWCFALVIVRRVDRFLLVQERKHGQSWYLPAGRVEAGESFAQAALRETLEESGIPVVLEGILRLEHSPSVGAARLRVIFLARPADDTPPKQIADKHSLGARWVTLDEAARLPLRTAGLLDLFRELGAGAPVYPLSLLTSEGMA